MRDKKSKFLHVKSVSAATGVKISAPHIDSVLAGMPLCVVDEGCEEELRKTIMEEIEDVLIETDRKGIIVKADTIGSLEAMLKLCKEKNIPIRKASIGPVTKKDVLDAESNYEQDPLHCILLGFNIAEAASTEKVKVITNQIIYKLLDDYEEWHIEAKKKLEARKLDKYTRPCKIQVLANCIFRATNPLIVGVEVLGGIMKIGTPLMKERNRITQVKSMQEDKKSVQEAGKGKQIAVSLPNVTAGRQVKEGDVLFSALSEQEFIALKKNARFLSKDEIQVLKEIAEIYREENPVWGV